MSTDAIVLLKNDHKDIKKAFRDFESAGENAHQRKGQAKSKGKAKGKDGRRGGKHR